MVIYVNILKIDDLVLIFQNIKAKQVQDFHRSVIDFNMSTFH